MHKGGLIKGLTTVALAAFVSAPAIAALSASADPLSSTTNHPVIAAAGDIACDPASSYYNGGNGTASSCHMRATSDLLVGTGLEAVLTLGDNQYEEGTLSQFQTSYDSTWGRIKHKTYPSVGNHEYYTSDASGYFNYFGDRAGNPSKGYYSFDVGVWHLIALNSNCSAVGGCGAGSPQEEWLNEDLASHASTCTLAYWHHPRFSSGEHGNHTFVGAFWDALYAADADVVLSGHDHTYERFAPQTPSGVANTTRGMRQFVVGTGGKTLYGFGTIRANSQVRRNDTYGVLRLTLRPSGYDWDFDAEAGKSFSDSGSDSCH